MSSPQEREAALFDLAVGKPAGERAVFLQAVCDDDPALRARLEALLAAHDQPETMLATQFIRRDELNESPNSASPRQGFAETGSAMDEAVGQTLGRYKLLERIGEGGCGVVYVAEQTEPVRRRVALKVIKLGMDTKQVVARFEAERQALAMMDHPNIAKVLDAGTTGPQGSGNRDEGLGLENRQLSPGSSPLFPASGRPYFVMELVRGIRITDYCDQANLSTKERLDLFIKVCHAIQHAHQKGIIHRDIKPSNILVTLHDGVPVPKVIDFGIAKATEGRLTDNTVYTQLHQFMGTPAYMSPEQAEMSGLDIDTRSDIYSLGVLLYELLAGSTPFDAKELMASGIDAMRKTIREKEPVRPSTRLATIGADELTTTARRRSADTAKLLHQLKGDLDWIVMKCLEKDRQRRYDTANGLALDITRHLNNEPVLARSPSFGYRFQKAWRRNRLLYSAAGAVVATLVVGMSVSLSQASRAMRARSQAIDSQRAEQEQRLTADRERENAVRARQLAEGEKVRADHEAANARQNAYVSDMNLASQAWETGNLLGVRELLSRHRPQAGEANLRGFEWRLLWGLAHEDKTRFRFHTGSNSVASVAISRDGQWLAWCGKDGRVRIVDVEAGSERFVLPGHSPQITSLAFSADGRWLASGGTDGLIGIWHVPLWTLKGLLKGHIGSVNSLSFHPDKSGLVSSADDSTVRIWDLTTLEAERVFPSPEKSPRLSVSPDGRWLATFGGLDNSVRFWSLEPEIRQLPTLPPQQGIILSVTFASHAETAVISTHDSRVTKWELNPLRPGVTYWQKVLAGHVALSADGKILVTGGNDNLLKVWRAASGQELRVLRGHTAAISHLALSADGNTLVSADMSNEIKVWATDPTEDANVLAHDGLVASAAISPDGEMLATSDPNFFTVLLWNLRTRSATPFITNYKAQAAFSPDGKWLAIGPFNGAVELWDRTTTPYRMAQVLPRLVAIGYHLNFSPDSQILAFRAAGDVVELWDIAAQKSLGRLQNHSSSTCGTAFSSDGELIATGSDRQVRIWQVRSQRLLAAITDQSSEIRSVCFSPDANVLAAASGNAEVRRWNIKDPRHPQTLTPLSGHTAFVPQIAYSPDGKTLATASYDSTLRLWNAALGEEVATLRAHSAVVQCLTWSADGRAIFTGSGDATVRIWRAPSWEEIAAVEAKEKADIKQP